MKKNNEKTYVSSEIKNKMHEIPFLRLMLYYHIYHLQLSLSAKSKRALMKEL